MRAGCRRRRGGGLVESEEHRWRSTYRWRKGKDGGWSSHVAVEAEAELEEAEMKMLKFSLVITRMEKIRTENISSCRDCLFSESLKTA